MTMRIIRITLLSIVLALSFGMTAYASGGNCGYKGCTRRTEGCHNGTVFCDIHAAAYAREKGYDTCDVSGCYDYAGSGGKYCTSHTCRNSKCSNKAAVQGGYCANHGCKYSGCTSAAYYKSGRYKGYCNIHAYESGSKSSSTSSAKKTTTSKSTSTVRKSSGSSKKSTSSTKSAGSTKSTGSKKYKMPDCDDYESYDDFMDDWDGNMPDGSDAEDYWDNW